MGYGTSDLSATIATHIRARENHETARISIRKVGTTGYNSIGRECSDTVFIYSKAEPLTGRQAGTL